MSAPTKKISIVAGCILLVIIGLYTFYRVKKQSFLDHGLNELVESKSRGLYDISYDSIYVNEASGNLFIKNLRLLPDTARQWQLVNAGDTNAVKLLIEAYVPSLEVHGFKTAKALLAKRLDCSYIIIDHPQVKLHFFPGVGTNDENQDKQLYQQILGNLRMIKADSVSVVGGVAVAYDAFTKEEKFRTIDTRVDLYGVGIDSTYNADTSRTFFCKEINVNIGQVALGKEQSKVVANNVLFNTRNDLVSIGRIEHTSTGEGHSFKGVLLDSRLTGLTINGPVEQTKVKVRDAVFEKTAIETISTRTPKEDDKPSLPQKILTGWIKHLELGNFNFKSIDYENKQTDDPQKSFSIKNSSIQGMGARIDTTSSMDETLIRNARAFEFKNDLVVLNSGNGKYQCRISGLHLSAPSRRLTVKEIKVIPKLGEDAFMRKSKYQTDRYDIALRDIVCTNVSVEKLVKGDVFVDEVSTRNNYFKAFRDLGYPIDSATREKPPINFFPHQEFHRLKSQVSIKKFTATNSYIEYKEKNDISHQSGRVRFNHSSIVVDNLSNIDPKPGDKITARFTTTLLDSIPLTGKFVFYSDNYRRGDFEMEATSIKKLDGQVFNPLMIPMGLTRVDKGTLYSSQFHITGDTIAAKGEVTLSYEGLKMSLLKKPGDTYHKKNVFSFLANALIRDNSGKDNQPRKAQVQFKYDRYKSFFSYVWKTMYTGIRKAMLKV